MNSKETHSAAATKSESHPSHEEIAEAAYRLYEKNGRQEGRDLEYWLEAEKNLSAVNMSASLPPMEFAESQERDGGNGRDKQSAKTRKNAANREEIRRLSSAMRDAPRQSQRPQEHSA